MCRRALPRFETTLVRYCADLKRHLLNTANPYCIIRLTLSDRDHIGISTELTTIRAFALDVAAVGHILVEVGAGQKPQPAQAIAHLI